MLKVTANSQLHNLICAQIKKTPTKNSFIIIIFEMASSLASEQSIYGF